MNRVRTIFSHGKFMEVISADPAPRNAHNTKDGFAMVPLEWTADVAKALNAPDIMLVNLMLYLSWKAKGEDFLLSNETLYGTASAEKRNTGFWPAWRGRGGSRSAARTKKPRT
jgi:hypothetical protein